MVGSPVALASGEPDPVAGSVFSVHLDVFEGPFDLLLGLIAQRRLDLTSLALSQVTDEFLAHIRALGRSWDLGQATDFLVVAATLLDLKAARLLPSAPNEDEEDLALLEARDLLGGNGILLDHHVMRHMADIEAIHTYEGTENIQTLIVGRDITGVSAFT